MAKTFLFRLAPASQSLSIVVYGQVFIKRLQNDHSLCVCVYKRAIHVSSEVSKHFSYKSFISSSSTHPRYPP